MNSPRTALIVTLCGRRARGQFFSFIQMMLDGGKCLLSKLLQILIVPFRPVFPLIDSRRKTLSGL